MHRDHDVACSRLIKNRSQFMIILDNITCQQRAHNEQNRNWRASRSNTFSLASRSTAGAAFRVQGSGPLLVDVQVFQCSVFGAQVLESGGFGSREEVEAEAVRPLRTMSNKNSTQQHNKTSTHTQKKTHSQLVKMRAPECA